MLLAFVTNRSFIDSRTFDGFRALVAKEFAEIHVVDLGGDVRANPKLSGTKNNAFGIQTGVAISFLVKREKSKECRIFYARRAEMETAEDKLGWLSKTKLSTLTHTVIRPDSKHNWLDLTDNDFESLIPIASKAAKASTKASQERAIFKLFSLGAVTARDEWVYGAETSAIESRVRFLIDTYNAERSRLSGHKTTEKLSESLDYGIKWSRAVKRDLLNDLTYEYRDDAIVESLYRPFVKQSLYFDKKLNEMTYQLDKLFPRGVTENPYLAFVAGNRLDFALIAGNCLPNYAMYSLDPAQCLPLHRFDNSTRRENITDRALKQFKDRYQPGKGKKAQPITKESIFHYVYAVLHDPIYREKYALNLKREFPRIPLYPDFWQWSACGKTLIDLHIGYEQVEPWPLKRLDIPDEKTGKNGGSPKAILKADRDAGRIVLDSETSLLGVPPEAWTYKLGNRCALEWILDQHKEKTPKDPTIRAHFNTCRFADYKDVVIDLLMRFTRVKVETQAVVGAMAIAARA